MSSSITLEPNLICFGRLPSGFLAQFHETVCWLTIRSKKKNWQHTPQFQISLWVKLRLSGFGNKLTVLSSFAQRPGFCWFGGGRNIFGKGNTVPKGPFKPCINHFDTQRNQDGIDLLPSFGCLRYSVQMDSSTLKHCLHLSMHCLRKWMCILKSMYLRMPSVLQSL